MQINSLNFYNFKTYPLLPKRQPYAADNFCGRIGIDGTKMQRQFANFPCPSCGIQMLTYKETKQLFNMPDNTPSAKVIPLLEKFEKSMHPVEKEVFNILKDLSKKYPKKNLRELLDTIRTPHLYHLHEEQNKILKRLNFVGYYLPEKSRKILEETLKETKEILDDKTYNEQFKRRVFVGKIKYATMDFPEEDVSAAIFKIAEEMPKASNSTSAFIVKHTEKKPSTGKERTSHDIIFALLAPSIGSIEHIKVRSKNIKDGGGKDTMSNYLLICARCNNNRSSTNFAEFLKTNPHLYGPHLRKYIDLVIQKLNEGKLKGFEKYLPAVAKTLKKESKGMLKIDISKLNIPDA